MKPVLYEPSAGSSSGAPRLGILVDGGVVVIRPRRVASGIMPNVGRPHRVPHNDDNVPLQPQATYHACSVATFAQGRFPGFFVVMRMTPLAPRMP